MSEITAITALLQSETLQPKQSQAAQKDFSAVLENMQQVAALENMQEQTAAGRRVYEENLQARIETAAQDIRKEATSGVYAANNTKAVVGLVNQDFWRQAFSPAIAENERNSSDLPSLSGSSSGTPVLDLPLFDSKLI